MAMDKFKKLGWVAILAIVAAIAFLVPRHQIENSGPTLQIGSQTLNVELANTPELRMQGLSGRSALEENSGMLFQFDTPAQYRFWMRGMRFNLDFIWIADGAVVEITHDVPAQLGVSDDQLTIYSPGVAADSMLEVNGGWAAINGIQVGDKVRLSAPRARP